MDKKISLKWLIFYLLLAFIGWQLYKPKPQPSSISLYEKGYIRIPIAGADFSKKKISVETVPKVKLWWTDKGECELGSLFPAGYAGRPTGGYPLILWLKKEDVIKLSEKERDQLGITIDQEGNVSAPEGLLGVKYTLY